MKICSKCKISKSFIEFDFNKSNLDGYQYHCKQCRLISRKNNKDKLKIINKNYREKNKEKCNLYSNNYRKINKEYFRKYNQIYRNKKYKTDILFNLAYKLRRRLSSALKNFNLNKTISLNDYIGCKIEELKLHLESKFVNGMSWDNRSKWHIDHIVPLSSAATEEEMYKLCHYTNLQPLWAKDNLSKGAKIEQIPKENS